VIVGIADARQLRGAWQRLYANVAQAQPGLALDGILIETMSPPGVELVVGARRDPRWGPVVLVGSGGVLVEALDDVRLMPADLPVPAIRDEISRLKGAKLLQGFRGGPPADIAAVAEVAALIGQLMRGNPQITEVDVNPLVAYPQGSGAVALDALVVAGQQPDQTGSMAAHSS
jgi:acetate---CoA ligase (ADP-forming)